MFRAVAFWEQKIPLDITVEERHLISSTRYKNKLITDIMFWNLSPKSWVDRRVITRSEKVVITVWTLPNTLTL